MSTKNEVLALIKTIEDNGNNTAKALRNVLKEILDFTENVPQQPDSSAESAKRFKFSEKTKDKEFTELSYSFRGIEQHHVNFTFKLDIIKNTAVIATVDLRPTLLNFRFPIPKALLETLKSILKLGAPASDLNFIVPLEAPKLGTDNRIGIVKMGIGILNEGNEGFLVMAFSNINNSKISFNKGESISTSIHFHSLLDV